jgi:hypothetical protein
MPISDKYRKAPAGGLSRGKPLSAILLVFLCWFFAAQPEPLSSATTLNQFRCPAGSLILVNDRISEVRKKCGPPTEASQRQERKGWGYVLETVEIEEWTYNLGPTSFMVYLTFENGRLTRIESGEYGY